MTKITPMTAEVIGCRLKCADWSMLLSVLRLTDPAGLLLATSEATAFERLCDAGILTPAGERVLVDDLFALLLEQLSQAEDVLQIRASQRQVALYACADLWLIVERDPVYAVATPAPDFLTARTLLMAAVNKMPLPAAFSLRGPHAPLREGEAHGREALRGEVEALLECLLSATSERIQSGRL